MYNTGSLIEPARLSSYKKSTNTFNGKKTILIPCLSWSFIDEFFFILFTSAVCRNVTLTFHSYIVIIRKLYAIQSQKALDMDIKAEESGITALVNYQFTTSTHKKNIHCKDQILCVIYQQTCFSFAVCELIKDDSKHCIFIAMLAK